MDDDALVYCDEDVADLWAWAFDIADAHGAARVGMEHVAHAMTSLDAGLYALEVRKVDVGAVRDAAAHVIAAGGEQDEADPYCDVLSADDDVQAALDLAVEAARERGYDIASLDDVVDVLMGYQPGCATLVALFAALQGGRGARHHFAGSQFYEAMTPVGHPASDHVQTGMSGAADWRSDPAHHWAGDDREGGFFDARVERETARHLRDTAAALSRLEERVGRLEVRAGNDHDRIGHALQELSRHRALLPADEDWRTQMQTLVSQIDALRAQMGRVSAGRREEGGSGRAAHGAGVSDDAFTAAVARLDAARSDSERRVSGLMAMMERQQRDLERLANALTGLERAWQSAGARGAYDAGGGSGRVTAQGTGSGRAGATGMSRGVAMAQSSSAASRTADGGASLSRSTSTSTSTSTSASSSRSSSGSGSGTTTSATSSNASRSSQRRRRRRASSGRARSRRRTWRRFGRLRLASVARFGLKRKPKRRERSWWPWLGSRERWRTARAQGGRFRAFGERFNHRGARPARQHAERKSMRRERAPRNAAQGGAEASAEKRFYLAIDDDIVDAPSIGPKTAERLRPARIFTVRDLLEADPEEVASIVTARHITAQAVRDWQDQARLVITIPFLRGTHAQILVGAGFRSYEDVALADQATLMSAILTFATTREGQSILRNGPPPDLEKVVKWMENALESEPARAA